MRIKWRSLASSVVFPVIFSGAMLVIWVVASGHQFPKATIALLSAILVFHKLAINSLNEALTQRNPYLLSSYPANRLMGLVMSRSANILSVCILLGCVLKGIAETSGLPAFNIFFGQLLPFTTSAFFGWIYWPLRRVREFDTLQVESTVYKAGEYVLLFFPQLLDYRMTLDTDRSFQVEASW